jgi:hypothetical protein
MRPAPDFLRICATRSCEMLQDAVGRVPLRPTTTTLPPPPKHDRPMKRALSITPRNVPAVSRSA